MDLSIPLELRQIQDLVRALIDRELVPLEQQVDQADDIDPAAMYDLRKPAVELGICGFNLPSELGGGIGPLGEVLVGQEIGRTSMPLGEVIGRLPQSLTLCDQEQADWLVKSALQGWPTVRNRHTDYQAAKATGLRELFIKFFGTGFVGGSLSVKFIGFVAIDDTVTVRGVVTDRDTEGDRVKLTVDLRAENQRGTKVVAGTATGYAD